MQRNAVITENGERKEEGVSEGWVRGSRDVLSGKGWPTAPAQPFRLGFKMPQMWLHNKLLSILVNAACSMCLCTTLSCVLRAWKVQVGGSECRQQVWLPGMGSSTYGRKSSSPVFQLVARIPWRPSIARQTGGKKCFHMPYNLQTATIETSSAYFSPFPLGIQTQLFSEITSSRSLAMWLSRAGKLVICILRQSLELLFQGLSVFSLQAPAPPRGARNLTVLPMTRVGF